MEARKKIPTEMERERGVSKEGEKMRRCQKEAKERESVGKRERVWLCIEKAKESELKRLLSGSEKLFLAVYWLSLSA